MKRSRPKAQSPKPSLVTAVLIVIASTGLLAQVSYQRLLNAEKEPQNWLTYAGSYKSHRHSPLTLINRQNAGQLKLAWAYQMQRPGVVETSPIVVDGVMYLTEPPNSTVPT